jgi:cytochrome c556
MSLDEIIRQANQDNLEGVTLGFNQLTVSCVQCHKHLRETK